MAESVEKHEKAVRRFGVRYGRTVKKKLGKVEAQQKKLHPCPYCRYVAVKWQATGIWHCRKCRKQFTSRAFTVAKPSAIKAEMEEL